MSEGRIIRVDMTDQSVSIDPFPEEWHLLGGRALSAKILLAECDATCDPLGPDNVLVVAPGALAGTSAPTSGRISIGGKSPLTGGIKEANAGGNPGQDLMKLGYRAIIVKGQPGDRDKRWALDVTEEGATLKDATEYKGLWNYALIGELAKTYSATASFISIGPAGELELLGASVACTDQEKERHPVRHAGRGGLGAVMGSKCLKYVSVDAAKKPARAPADREAFIAATRTTSKAYLEGPRPMQHGTSTSVGMAQILNTFPYKNRIEGQSPDAETLDGHRIIESFETRGGGMHNCQTGCIVKCSNVVHDEDGNYKTSALEFETLTLLGSNCGLASWEDVADLDRLCDDIGLDTIETGAAIGVYMDSGAMEFGDAEGAKHLMREIAEGSDVGRTIGNGAVATGKRQKHHRVPTVRGQAIPAWDPRPLKATGVTYLTSPQGADHTAGLVVNPGLAPEDMPAASRDNQVINAAIYSSGFCMFLMLNLDQVRTLYSAFFGEECTRKAIFAMGWQCLEDEWEFNRRAGFKREDDVMPDCMMQDAIGPQKVVFDVDPEIVAKTYEPYEPDEAFWSKGGTG